MADQTEFPVGLTARGRAVHAGFNSLAVDGDDTLNPDAGTGAPDTDAGTEQTGEPENAPDSTPPVVESGAPETAVNVVADDRETREI